MAGRKKGREGEAGGTGREGGRDRRGGEALALGGREKGKEARSGDGGARTVRIREDRRPDEGRVDEVWRRKNRLDDEEGEAERIGGEDRLGDVGED